MRKLRLHVRSVAMSSALSKPKLQVDWCSHAAAKFACEHWHYTGTTPKSKSVYLGVWEEGVFIGAVIFGMGASSHLGTPYGLATFQAAELTRVALRGHKATVSQIVAIALRMIKKQSPGLRLIVSYADPSEGHHGGIYQALGWLYVGMTQPDFAVIDSTGKRWHSRLCSVNGVKSQYGVRRKAMRPQDGKKIAIPGKHKYIIPLDLEMRSRVSRLAKPYPKRERSRENAAAGPPAEGGVIPTRSLQVESDHASQS